MRTLSFTAMAIVFAAGAAQAQTAPADGQTTTAAPTQPSTGQQANAPTAAGTATTAAPTVGATVYGSGGAPVGTIESVTAQGVVINTGSAKVAVPTASIGSGPNGPTVSLTREQLTAATAQAQAAGAASLTAGTSVKSSDGTSVGTVKSVDGQFVTLTTTKGAEVRLPASGIANGPTGAIIGMTSAQFDAATAGAKPAAGGAATSSGSGSVTGSAAAGGTPTSGAANNAAAGTGDTTATPSATSSTTTTTTKKTTRRR